MTFPKRLPIPPEVLKIAKRLEEAGYETWCVGGSIRDKEVIAARDAGADYGVFGPVFEIAGAPEMGD